jgi:hypothetical protein
VVVDAILRHARSGEVGDGKIFVLPVEEAIPDPYRRVGPGGAPAPRRFGGTVLTGSVDPLVHGGG